MQNPRSILVTAALSLLTAGCGGVPGLACTDLYAYGLNVTAKDDATSQPICDAVVKAVDGSYSEQFERIFIGTSDCAYTGAGLRLLG